jgi:hypothetical protein
LGLVGAAALFLVLLSSAGVFILHYFKWKSDGTAQESDSPSSPSATQQRKGPTKETSGEREAGSDRAGRKPHPARKTGKTSAGKGMARNPQGELLLQSVAVLTVGHLSQGYLNIGLLADGVEGDVYEKDEAVRMLKEVTNTLRIVDRQLARLDGLKLTTEDRRDVEHVRKLNKLLRAQAQALRAFWKDPTAARALKFKKTRRAAWSGIKPLLGLEKE